MAQKLNTGTSIVDYLKSIGKDSSYQARARLAVQLGIVKSVKEYKGSAQQNTTMLRTAKKEYGTGSSTAKTADKPATKVDKPATKKADKPANKGAIADDVKTNVTTGVDSTATEVVDNLAQLINAAIPNAGDYSYEEFKNIATETPALQNAQDLAKLYGLDYDLESIYNTLMKANDAGYDARYEQQKQVEGKYYTNAAVAQNTLTDTLQKQQSQAILTGANKGMQAAQALSSMLGTSQQFAAEATQLAQDRQLIAKEQAASTAMTGVNALNAYNTMGQQLADVSKTVYSADTSKYVGQLDYNAANTTANAQLQSQGMASKAQWESTYANNIASAYQQYYSGQITLEQARIQADAAIESAKVYGLDAANVTAAANKQIAMTNQTASNYNASKNYDATKYAADRSAAASAFAATKNAQATAAASAGYNKGDDISMKMAGANLIAGLMASYNLDDITAEDAEVTLQGWKAAGFIDQSVYDNALGMIKKPIVPVTKPDVKVDAVSMAQPPNKQTPPATPGNPPKDPYVNEYYEQWKKDPNARVN